MSKQYQNSPWSEERTEQLLALQREGHSCSIIAGQLGGGLTRNAVISKLHRLGVTGDKSKYRAAWRRRSPAEKRADDSLKMRQRRTAVTKPLPPSRPTPLVEPTSKKLTIYELTNHVCRWPSDEDQPPFTYCGNDRVEESPYCAFHRSIAIAGQATQKDFDRIAARTMAGNLQASKTFVAEVT